MKDAMRTVCYLQWLDLLQNPTQMRIALSNVVSEDFYHGLKWNRETTRFLETYGLDRVLLYWDNPHDIWANPIQSFERDCKKNCGSFSYLLCNFGNIISVT